MSGKITKSWQGIFNREFKKESDRASVILSAAMLDLALESVLKSHLVPTDSPDDSLIGGVYTPISTFNARIDLARRLGLISIKFCRDLHIIRKIRNEFSHNIEGCSFDNSSVRNRVFELMRSSGVAERNPKMRERLFMKGTKGDFEMTISWMLWRLWNLAKEVDTIEPARLEFAYIVGERMLASKE